MGPEALNVDLRGHQSKVGHEKDIRKQVAMLLQPWVSYPTEVEALDLSSALPASSNCAQAYVPQSKSKDRMCQSSF